MAPDQAYLDAARLLLGTEAQVLVVGLIPFTRRLALPDPLAFARALKDLAEACDKAVGLVLDAGPDYAGLRMDLAAAGLPVFSRMEEALVGLQALG